MRSLVARAVLALVFVVVAPGCGCGAPLLPDPPRDCDALTGRGCLPDEVCVDGTCEPVGKCDSDDDCPSGAYRCVFPAQFCDLRPGFGEECSPPTADSPGAPCPAGEFCALGVCRSAAESRPCGSRLDCPPGQGCDKQSFFCIEEAPCTLADTWPELACDVEESCNTALGACVSACVGQCTPETQAEDCGPSSFCNGACRCVQCLSNADCGPGLVCNVRAGQCQSENLCFTDDDCDAPLICDPRTALCQVAPPACFDDFDCTVAERCNVATGRCELPGGACIDDRLEDADTPANAEDITLARDQPKLVDDLQLCPDDDDVYAFTLATGDRLTITATRTAPEARATLWLLDEDAETSIAFAETAPRGSGTVTTTAQTDQVVYLRVNALLAPSPYDLTVTVTQAGACAVDFFETGGGGDDNDTAATATSPLLAPPGIELSAEICPDDVDFYAVDVDDGFGVRATVAFDPTRADLDVALLDETGAVVADASDVVEPAVVERRFVTGGRFFVRVRGFANARGPYTLLLEQLAPLVCNDALEPDDDTPRIVDVPYAVAGAPVVQQRQLCGSAALADVDRWQVFVEDFERLVAQARPAEASLRVILTIEDATGRVLARSPSGTGASSVSFDATSTGPLFVRAAGAFGQRGAYTATLSRENQTSCAADAFEPNNTPATRVALPEPTGGATGSATDVTATICESDEDHYALSGVAGKRAVVDLAFLHGQGDLDLQLLGIDGRQILATSDGQTDGERVEAILPVDGVYTIRVFSLTSGAKSRYTLTTTLQAP